KRKVPQLELQQIPGFAGLQLSAALRLPREASRQQAGTGGREIGGGIQLRQRNRCALPPKEPRSNERVFLLRLGAECRQTHHQCCKRYAAAAGVSSAELCPTPSTSMTETRPARPDRFACLFIASAHEWAKSSRLLPTCAFR